MEESAVRKIPPGVGTRFLPDDGCIAQEVASTGQILQELFTPKLPAGREVPALRTH